MNLQTLKLEVDSRGVASLSLNRPDVHNAMNMTLIREMRSVLAELRVREDIRALILTGAGKSFCAGGDLRWMQAIAQQKRKERIADAAELARMLGELNALNTLVICRVNGAVYGGGLGLVSCCDIALGAHSAVFALTEATLGLIPATISPFVVRRIGESHARRVMLNAKRFDAEEAARLGLLHRAVPDEELDDAVGKEIRNVMRCAPQAVAASKVLISAVIGHSPEDCRDDTAGRLADTWETESAREGISAFLEKRKPVWMGL